MDERYEVESETFSEATEDVVLIRNVDGTVTQVETADDEDGDCDAGNN